MAGAFFGDLRYAIRVIRRSPGFSAAVVLTLALGVGPSTAIFSLVYGVLFRPLPYREFERLVVIRMERVLEGTQRPVRALFPLADLAELQSTTRALESVAFYATQQSMLLHNGFAEKVDAALVSESFFADVGGRLQSGRGLAARQVDASSAVISNRLRLRLFGTSEAVGRALTIGNRSYEVVGVASSSFQLPAPTIDVWLPAVELPCCAYSGIGRLKAGVTSSQAVGDLNAMVPALTATSPRIYGGAHASVVPLREEITGDVRVPLWVLLVAVGLLLAVACANATNLLVARNLSRSRETAVRVALGASRRRLASQSLAHALLVVTASAALGIAIAVGLIDALISLGSSTLPRLDAGAVRVDLPVFGFALAMAAVTTVVIGLLPALGFGSVAESLKAGAHVSGAGPSRRKLQNGLVIVQLAVSLVLLVSASLLGRSLVRLMTTDIGVRTDHVATAAVNLTYQRKLTDAQQAVLVDAIVDRVRALPNVQTVGVGAGLPPATGTISLTLKRGGDNVAYQATAVPATPGYFPALGLQLLKGRFFTEADAESSQQVMIMTADTARRFFDTDDPIGRTMTLPIVRDGKMGGAEMTLVGVVANVKHSGLEAAADDAVYRPLRQQPWSVLFVVARTSGDPSVVAAMLRREIAAVDPAIAVASVNTLDAIVAGEAAQPRFRSLVLTAMATLTLAIAAVGLYGVVAYAVSQRTRELGVRAACGASSGELLRLVLVDGLRLGLAGVVLGIGGAIAATRLLTNLLYGIDPADALSFALAAGLMLLVAAVAAYVPARRAARLDPTSALRAE